MMAGFEKRSAQRIAKVVREYEREPKGEKRKRLPRNPIEQRWIPFTLEEDMGAATDPLTGATATEAKVLRPDRDYPPEVDTGPPFEYTPQRLIESSEDTIYVVNRSVDASASSGTYGLAAWVNGEWLLVWIDC